MSIRKKNQDLCYCKNDRITLGIRVEFHFIEHRKCRHHINKLKIVLIE